MSTQRYLHIISDNISPHQFGSKGKHLKTLWQNNFHIPLTLCLTVETYNHYTRINQIENKIRETLSQRDMATNQKSGRIMNMIVNSITPDEIRTEILENSYFNKIESKWAVRSSSNMEDLPGLSFAGLHDSYLNVQGPEQILKMVKHCWASLWNERAILYREKNNLDHMNASMAVIIQQMVDARYSGVIFTQDPSNEACNEMLVEYCEGLGEDLVSGKITPCSCMIDKNTRSIRYLNTNDKGMLTKEQLTRLLTLALSIEKCFESPQDIEWAYDGENFYLLQTRPITNLKKHDQIGLDKVWTRANIGEVLPDAVTPLTWAIFKTILIGSEAFKDVNQDNGSHQKVDRIALIKGHGYIRLDLFLDSFCYLPFVTPEIMNRVLGVQIPANIKGYKRPKGIPVVAAKGLFFLSLLGKLPRLSFIAKGLPDIADIKAGGIQKIIEWNKSCFQAHLTCTAYAIGAFAFLVSCLHKWLPEEVEKAVPVIMIGNTELQTAAQGTTLLDLALYINRYPDLKTLIFNNHDWDSLKDRLIKVDGGDKLLAMMKEFLHHNGARAAGEFELAIPRWRENPSFIMMIIQRYLNANDSSFVFPDIKSRLDEHEDTIKRIAALLTPFKRWIFLRALKSYREFSTSRENMKYQLMEGYEELRNHFLVIGRALVDKSVLKKNTDIFFLEPHEIKTLMSSHIADEKIDKVITERKRQYELFNKEYVPDLITHDISMSCYRGANNISGIGCSPGTVKGCARVLRDISEAKSLEPGEILVTPHTDPGWTPLFLICSGLITEKGGFLSHGATVAREYGIPAVVNVPQATLEIQTGDLVIVNGNTGQVIISERRPSRG